MRFTNEKQIEIIPMEWNSYRAHYTNKKSNIECLFFLCIETYGPPCMSLMARN